MSHAAWIAPLLACATQAPFEGGDPIEELRVGARAALARPADWQAVRLAGQGSLWGTEVGFELRVGAGGELRLELDGRLSLLQVFDGGRAWERDATGAIWEQDFFELDRRRWLAWTLSGAWLDPARAELVLEADDGSGHELRWVEARALGGAGRARLALWRASLLPARLELLDGATSSTIEFEGWTELADGLWPGRVTQDGARSGIELRPARGELLAGLTRTELARPQSQPADVRWTADVGRTVEARLSPSGHLLVRAQLDGQDVGWFGLDTGGGLLSLDQRIADRLGLERFGRRRLFGAVSQTETQYVRARTLESGPLTLVEPLFLLLDTQPMAREFGMEIAGFLGADLLRRAQVEIDWNGPKVALRSTCAVVPGARWTHLRFDRRLPCVEGRLLGLEPAWFIVDTGSTKSLILHSPFVALHRLTEGRELRPFRLGGIGGAADLSAGTLERLEVLGQRFEAVDTVFAPRQGGGLDSPWTAGILGGGVLRTARIVFDYPCSRVGLVAP